MPNFARRLSDQIGLYRWLRCSRYYEYWAKIKRPEFAKEVANDRRFFTTLFREQSIQQVFDVGANIGDKTKLFAELGCRIVCVEADPAMAKWLAYRFSKCLNVIVEDVAVGGESGVARMFRKKFSGFNTLSEKWSHSVSQLGVANQDEIEVSMTTLEHLINRHGLPDYVKIDVEGYELPTIRGLSRPVRVLSFEANVPTFLAETRQIVERLNEFPRGVVFNYRFPDEPTFRLPHSISPQQLMLDLERLGPATCDVFAFRRSSS